MATLLRCRVCEGKVSSDAPACPHCGDPYVTEEKKRENESRQQMNKCDIKPATEQYGPKEEGKRNSLFDSFVKMKNYDPL